MPEMIPAWVNGNLTPMEKIEVHRRGLRHKAVSVFVTDRGRLLIQRRAMSKYHTPGLWANTCCTHPAWGEDPTRCTIRRLREELGINGLYPAYRETVEYRAAVGDGMIEHEVVELFFATAPRRLEISANPDEVMQAEWIDLYDLAAEVARRPERFTPWLQIYMQDHKDTIFGSVMRA